METRPLQDENCPAHASQVLPIPQRDGSIKLIEALSYKVAKKSPGVHFTGDNKPTKEHTEWIEEKGKTWTDKLRNNGFVTSQDGWKSLNTQLKPKLEFGLVTMCAPPKKLEDFLERIQHNALSLPGFNQKIYTKLRTALAWYQGMGMFELNNSCMEFKVLLMQEYWNKDNCLIKMMKLVYETFSIDTRLGGDVFSKDYNKLHRLAEKCWCKHMWCLCDFLQAKVFIDK